MTDDMLGTDDSRVVEITFRFINASVAALAKSKLEQRDGFEVELRSHRFDENDFDEYIPDKETVWAVAWLRTARMDEHVVEYVWDVLGMKDESEIYILTCGPAPEEFQTYARRTT